MQSGLFPAQWGWEVEKRITNKGWHVQASQGVHVRSTGIESLARK